MPRLEIDNRTVEVPRGTKVIAAAEKLGIYIPRFCYHEALGSVGACRMCAVMFLEGPVKGLNMSCMVEAKDGMVVSTDHPEAQRFRSWIIDWMMINHPHDCPVCDEGGHCLLQDMTVSGGHGVRHYDGPKRTYHDQYLGPLVAHEMNRCIHCWRCRRYYQEYAGYRDLGAMQIGWRTYFGRQSDGRLESPFAGNLIDLCPTGVYTDKPSRFKGRRWDFVRSDSICPHCSLGCAITVNTRYRQVIRLEARRQPAVNGHFICDRGRYGYGFAGHPQRPRLGRVDGGETEVAEAIETAAQRLKQVGEKYGLQAVAALGSARLGLEAQAALARLSQQCGWSAARFFLEPELAMRVHGAVQGLRSELAISQTELFGADFILAMGVDPLAEAPMLALAMRQAVRNGAEAALLDPRPLELPFEFAASSPGLRAFGGGGGLARAPGFGAKTRIKLDQAYPDLLQPVAQPIPWTRSSCANSRKWPAAWPAANGPP
jgi:NADH-quinone oxidoreductase subunit G